MGSRITRHEIEDCSTEALQAKLNAVMVELVQTQNVENRRLSALASYETISAELARKRALGDETDNTYFYP